MGARRSRGGPPRASPPAGASAVPLHVPPPAAWQPSGLVRRPPVRVKRPSSIPSYLFWLVVLGAIVTGAWYYQLLDFANPNSPRATGKAFMQAVYAGDTDRVQELCTAATQSLLGPLEQAGRRARNRAEAGQPREASWRATAAAMSGDRATVTIDQTLTQGPVAESSEFVLTLLQEDGKWRVDLAGEPGDGGATVRGLSGLVGWS